MKKLSRSLLLLVLAFALVLPTLVVFAASANDADGFSSIVSSGSSITEYSQKANEETLALAKNAVQKAANAVAFFYLSESTLERQYKAAKFVIPEISSLEAKSDASLALIELYEELLCDFREYDIDAYHAFWKNTSDQRDLLLTDSVRYGQDLYGKLETIEALLAVNHYYDLLNENGRQRMMAAFEEVATLHSASIKKIYNEDAACTTYFEKFRTSRESELSKTSEPRSFSIITNGILYLLGSPVSTLDGDSVSTLYATNEFDDEIISGYKDAFFQKPGYLDLDFIAPASSFYNCHAYAWYSTNPGRNWIDNTLTISGTTYHGVERFISDDHCENLGNSESAVQTGDIIVYWDNGTIAHSGIVVGTNPIRIQSKWGPGCVWEHNVSSVPQDYKDGGLYINVTYYRYSHDYEYVSINDTKHEQECIVCSHTKNEENHTPSYVSKNSTQHTKECTLCGHVWDDEEHDLDCVEAGTVRHRVFCHICNFSKYAPHTLVNGACTRCDYVNDNLNSIGDETIDVMQE